MKISFIIGLLLLSLHLLLDDKDGYISQWVTALGNGSLNAYFCGYYGWNIGTEILHHYISWYISFLSLYIFIIIATFNLYLKIKWESIIDKLFTLLFTTYFIKDIIVYVINGNAGLPANYIDWTWIAIMALLITWSMTRWKVDFSEMNEEIDFNDPDHVYLSFRGVHSIPELIQAFWGLAFGCVKPIAGGYVYYFHRKDNRYVKKPIKKTLEGHISIKLNIPADEFIKAHDKNIGLKMSNLTNCASILKTLKIFGYKTSVFPSLLALYFIKKPQLP